MLPQRVLKSNLLLKEDKGKKQDVWKAKSQARKKAGYMIHFRIFFSKNAIHKTTSSSDSKMKEAYRGFGMKLIPLSLLVSQNLRIKG